MAGVLATKCEVVAYLSPHGQWNYNFRFGHFRAIGRLIQGIVGSKAHIGLCRDCIL